MNILMNSSLIHLRKCKFGIKLKKMMKTLINHMKKTHYLPSLNSKKMIRINYSCLSVLEGEIFLKVKDNYFALPELLLDNQKLFLWMRQLQVLMNLPII